MQRCSKNTCLWFTVKDMGEKFDHCKNWKSPCEDSQAMFCWSKKMNSKSKLVSWVLHCGDVVQKLTQYKIRRYFVITSDRAHLISHRKIKRGCRIRAKYSFVKHWIYRAYGKTAWQTCKKIRRVSFSFGKN